MAQIRIPTPLRKLTNDAEIVSADASNLGEAIDRLEGEYPGIKERIAASRIVLEKLDHAERVLALMGDFGADAGIFPHRLAEDVEEERRVFHVAITRGIEAVTVLAAADRTISIPMAPPVESLNVAVSAAVALYEARRQRSA